MKFNLAHEVKFFCNALMYYSAFFGSFVFWLLLAAILFILNQTAFALTVIVASFAAMLVEYAIKAFYKEKRPDFKDIKIYSIFQKWQEGGSFPSGHAANMALLTVLFHFEYGMIYLSSLFILLTVLSAAARIYLKRHYLKDVIGGLIMGIIIALIFI